MPVPDRMRFIDMTGTGGPEVLSARRGAGAAAGRWRGADPRSPPPASTAPISCSAAAIIRRRRAPRRSRARGRRHDRGARRRGRRAGRSATRSARWSPAAAMPSTASRPAPQCLPVPRGLSLVEAAGAARDLLHGLDQCVRARPAHAGESFLVHGGTSGIGTTAIQLARAFGARVFATAGSAGEMRGLRRTRRRAGDRLPAARISSRSSRRRPAGAASMSSSTWSAGLMSRRICGRSPSRDGWCRSRFCRAAR